MDFIKADIHLHAENDGWKKNYYEKNGKMPEEEHNFVEPDILQERLKECSMSGGVILCHSTPEKYEKDYKILRHFYRKEKNLIPGLEINIALYNPYFIKNVHITYLGKIPSTDLEYGCWFSHSTTYGGIFFSGKNKHAEKKNIEKVLGDKILMKKYDIRMVETTRPNLEDVALLNNYKLQVLVGTDSHPDKNKEYNGRFGKMGILLNAEEFNYNSFMKALKNNDYTHFSIMGNCLFYTERIKNKIIISMEKLN